MKVHFVTPTRISLINLTTIGDSEKREDETKIGKFSSGQAYSTALLLRSGVGMEINIYGGFHTEGEKYTECVNYSTINRVCESTNKSKEVIVLDYEMQFHGNCDSAHSFNEGHTEYQTIETAFALQLGYNWELWMAYRELMSNVIDEGGYVIEQDSYPEPKTGTVITLTFDENNAFYEVWQNRHLYMNEKEPLFVVSDKCEALENKEGYLRIYKQNILVYENEKVPSRFAWNIKLGTIDERRILSNVYSVEQDISYEILKTNNEEFLRTIITPDFTSEKKEFLSDNCNSWTDVSTLIHDIATEVYNEHGVVKSYDWIIDKIKKRKDCKIGGKKITTIEDSLWTYSKTVSIESTPQPLSEPSITVDDVEYTTPFASEISKIYNFKLDVEVKIAKLKGSLCVADKYEKCLIVDEKFDINKDFPSFIVEYLDLTQTGNVVDNLAKYICNLIKK